MYNERREARLITMEAIAKHDFNATAEDELSFPKGATLKVRPTQRTVISRSSSHGRQNWH